MSVEQFKKGFARKREGGSLLFPPASPCVWAFGYTWLLVIPEGWHRFMPGILPLFVENFRKLMPEKDLATNFLLAFEVLN